MLVFVLQKAILIACLHFEEFVLRHQSAREIWTATSQRAENGEMKHSLFKNQNL